MENDNEAQHTPHAEWGSLTGWETIVFQVEDDPERAEGRRQTAEVDDHLGSGDHRLISAY